MINRLRWWLAYRVAARRSAHAGTVVAYALARREQDRIRYRRP
jgi:hypothetical protein